MENQTKVLFLTKYSPKGASSRYRFYNYEKWFLENGIKPIYRPLFGDKYLHYLYTGKKIKKNIVAFYSLISRVLFLLFYGKKFEHVVIEAELFPRLPFTLETFFLDRMKSFSLDFDDNIAANYKGTSLEGKIPLIIQKANFVTVGNKWYFSEFKGNLIYLPTVVDIEKYEVHKNHKTNPFTIVWIGSPSTVKYLKLIEKELIKVSQRFNFILKIIGGNISLDPKIKTKFIEWDSKTENIEISESHIGIMPLENTYWEKGKCGFKLIQYMASGIPVIASDLPANREIIEEGINGFIAKNDEDWEMHFAKFLSNPNIVDEMGKSARNRIELNYTYQKWGNIYSQIIKENK